MYTCILHERVSPGVGMYIRGESVIFLRRAERDEYAILRCCLAVARRAQM